MKKSSPKSLHNPSTLSLNQSKIQKKVALTPTNKKKQKLSTSAINKHSKQSNNASSKSKSKSQPQDFIIIDDNIYCANTFTQRTNYDQFIKKIKKQKQIERKSFLIKSQINEKQSLLKRSRNGQNKKKFQKLSPQDLIQTMSLEEKKQMFYKLQEQIRGRGEGSNNNIKGEKEMGVGQKGNNSNSYKDYNAKYEQLDRNNKNTQSNIFAYQQPASNSFQNLQNLSQRTQIRKLNSQRQRKQKYDIIQQKIQTLKMQLMFKWQGQIDKFQQMCTKGKLTQKEKQNKINMIEKIKNHKLKILECTRTLFEKILKEEEYQKEHSEEKTNKIEAILQSLHSFPSLQNLDENYLQKQPNISHLKTKDQSPKNNQKSNKQTKKTTKQKQFFFSSSLSQQALQLSDLINNKISPTKKIYKQNTTQSSPLQIVQNNNTHAQFINEFYKQQESLQSKDSRIKYFSSQIQEIQKIYNERERERLSNKENYQHQNLDYGNNFKNNVNVQENFSGQQPDFLTGKMLLKLDLRIDEVVFGQDEYPQNEKEEEKGESQQEHHQHHYLGQNQNIVSTQKKQNIKKSCSQTSFGQNKLIKDNSLDNIKQGDYFKTNQFIVTNNHNQVSSSFQNPKNIQTSLKTNINIAFSEQQPKSPQTPSKYSLSSLLKFSSNKLSQNLKQQETKQYLQKPSSSQSILPNQAPKSTPTNTTGPALPVGSSVSSPSTSLPSQILSQTPDQQDESLMCKQQIKKQQKININIPLILTRDKMENLQYQKNRAFRQNIDRRIAFQMGCIEIVTVNQNSQQTSPSNHFTTLVDINTYIVGFYEFMMRKYLNTLVDNLNIPYGKSVPDKLYSLQVEGYVLQQSYNQMNNILSQGNFIQYQRQMMLTMRKCSQYETAHNRAVFEAFTKCINVYRPYYELQGEVYPWVVSQKGITFYEINEENIEEVFQKSKIKVLQYCTTLCGLHPPSNFANEDQKTMINAKWEQNLSKMIKNQSTQEYAQWAVRIVNFQCLVRLLVTQSIINELYEQASRQVIQIQQRQC